MTAHPLRGRALDLLAEWTAIPSYAGNAPALRRMADAVAGHLRGMGAEIVPDGFRAEPPIVHARFRRGAPVSFLLYNMYDVVPAGPEGWCVPSFTGGIVERPEGLSFVGRGAENNKGPLAGMLAALEHLLPSLPADVEVLVEGEEETGSAGLRRYLGDGRASGPVRRCGAALFPSFCEYGGGPPRVYLGTKGIAHGRIRVAGGDWGGPARPAHSSNAPWIGNPAWVLVHALARLGAGPTGFLDRVPLPADAFPVLRSLARQFDPEAELRFRTAVRYALEGGTAERLEAVLTTASLNLSELRTSLPDGRATIPPAAEARFDLRVPPGLDPTRLLDRLRDALHAAAPGAAELVVDDAYPGHRFAPDAPGVAALCDAYHAAGHEPQIWPWAVGAMPAYAFDGVAGGLLIGGLGRGGNAHGPDEFVTLDGLDRYLASLLAWLPATAARLSAQGGGPG